ncbi:MAG: hypothetical protein NC221_00780 [Duncaniella sp.]|nr:hypothetical protein [Duncaniella sp.]
MKKLILGVAVLAAMLTASCGSTEKKAEDEGATIKSRIENCTDPDSMKIYVRQAQEYADKLVKEGKDDAANAFMDEVVPAVQAKDPVAAASFAELKAKEAVDSLAAVAKDKVQEVSDSVSSKVDQAKGAAKDAAVSAKDKVAETASSVKDAAAQKTAEATAAAKEKAANAVQQGADKLRDALSK